MRQIMNPRTRHGMRRQGFQLAAVAAALVLVAGACSSDRSDEDPAGGDESSAAANVPTDTFGDLESPCGKGDASGATEQGVTDDSIAIGYGDDSGYANAPGLNEEMGDAMDAMVSWCNSQGGINGREIVGHRYDAALDNAAQVITEACGQDFMMVGEGFAGDEDMEADRIACQLVQVPGFTLSSSANNGPMSYAPLPFPVDQLSTARAELTLQTYPESSSYDFIAHDSPFTTLAEERTKAVMDAAGGKEAGCGVVLKSAGGDNYRALVQRYQECGATVLFDQGTPTPATFSFLDAMRVEGYEPTILTDATWYADTVKAANIDGLTEGVNVTMQFQPFENADAVPAVADYLSVMKAVDDTTTGLLGMQSTSAFLLWATAAKTCGSELTRQCMVNELSKVTSWTGGGLHAESDPAENLPPKCSLLMELKGGTYEQIAPATKGEFFCNDSTLETPQSSWGVELNEDRIATTYLTDDIIVPES
jgi:ABC-type branched-subunit amino acid transport system substrate-binding protein